MEVGRMSDEQSSAAVVAMAGGSIAAPGNATLRQGWQNVVMLRRGRQNVVARCCGEVDSGLQFAAAAMANSATTCDAGPAALQLAAMGDNALQPWPTLRCSIFVFVFFLTQQLQERKRET
jgi:hypothetical protein